MRYNIKYPLTALTALALLSACGGTETEQSSTTSMSGVLTDSPVAGVRYRCGGKVDRTDHNGTFHCETLPVSFSVGNIRLGTIETLPTDGYVTPQDLAGVKRDTYPETVVNIALFLQSLDDDGRIEHRITLDDALTTVLTGDETDISQLGEQTLYTLLEEAGAEYIVQREAALEHLRTHLAHLMPTADPNPVTIDTAPDTVSEPMPEEEPENTEQTEDREDPADMMPAPQPDTNFQQAYLDALNSARAEGRECGEYGYMPAVDPVTWSDALAASAYEHSRDMALSDTFSHTGSGTAYDKTAEALHPGEGSEVDERIEYNGYTDWQRYGENIAAGTYMDEIDEAMEGWLKSPGHCKNIMKESFREVGIARYYDAQSHYRYYWTQDFGSR